MAEFNGAGARVAIRKATFIGKTGLAFKFIVAFAKRHILQQYVARRMKLALVRRSFSPVGGAELYLNRLIDRLATSGHQIHLLTESWPESVPNLQVHQLPATTSRARRPWALARGVQRHLQSHSYDCVFSLERTLRQDVYRAGDGVHRMWLRRRLQFLPWWRTLWTGGFHRAILKLEMQTLNPANTGFVIVNSEMIRKEIESLFFFPRERIILIRNGVDVPRFRSGRRADTRAKLGFGDHDFICLFVGSGWERKGLEYVVRALPEVQRKIDSTRSDAFLKLVVAGKGRAFDAGPNVIFAGAVPDVENLYAAADLLTFTPIYEPSANVCIEALAAGLPVLTSSYNGAAELITSPDRGAVIENPSDVPAISAEIARRANTPERKRVAVPANDLSIERNVAETLRVLERAASSRRSEWIT